MKETSWKNIKLYRGEPEIDYIKFTEESLKKVLGKEKYNKIKNRKVEEKRCFLCGSYDVVAYFKVDICKDHVEYFLRQLSEFTGKSGKEVLKEYYVGTESGNYCMMGHTLSQTTVMAQFLIPVCPKCLRKIQRSILGGENGNRSESKRY